MKIMSEIGVEGPPQSSSDVAVRVVGAVVSESGEPLSGAEVVFVRGHGDSKRGKAVFDDVPWGTSVQVNAAGYFWVEGEGADVYLLEVTKRGYWSVEVEFPQAHSCLRVALAKRVVERKKK